MNKQEKKIIYVRKGKKKSSFSPLLGFGKVTDSPRETSYQETSGARPGYGAQRRQDRDPAGRTTTPPLHLPGLDIAPRRKARATHRPSPAQRPRPRRPPAPRTVGQQVPRAGLPSPPRGQRPPYLRGVSWPRLCRRRRPRCRERRRRCRRGRACGSPARSARPRGCTAPGPRQPAGRGNKAALWWPQAEGGWCRALGPHWQRYPRLLDGAGGKAEPPRGALCGPDSSSTPREGSTGSQSFSEGSAAISRPQRGCRVRARRRVRRVREQPASIPARQPEPSRPPAPAGPLSRSRSTHQGAAHPTAWLLTLLRRHSRHFSCGIVLWSRQIAPYFGFSAATHTQYITSAVLKIFI